MLNKKGISKLAINTYEQLCEIYLCINRFNIIVCGSKSIFILLIFQLHLYNGLNNKEFLLIDAQIKKLI